MIYFGCRQITAFLMTTTLITTTIHERINEYGTISYPRRYLLFRTPPFSLFTNHVFAISYLIYFGRSMIENSSKIFLQTAWSSMKPVRWPTSSSTSRATVPKNLSGLRPRLTCGRRQGSMVEMVWSHTMTCKSCSALFQGRYNLREIAVDSLKIWITSPVKISHFHE